MNHFYIAATTVFGIAAYAFGATKNLGQPLSYKLSNSGGPAFGVTYSYGKDPDGTSYLFNFTPKVSPSEGAKTFRWNYYLRSSDSFLLEWSDTRKTSLTVMQVLVTETKPELKEVINQMLMGQRKISGENELYLVLADTKNNPVFNIAVSDLCEKHPDNFHDLTYEKRCDELSP